MATSVIDIALSLGAFPSTYTGTGTLIGNCVMSVDSVASVSGYFTGNGNTISIPLGFQPAFIKVWDETNNIRWEWARGMSATKCVKSVAAGTTTIDSGSAIVVTTDNSGNGSVTLSTTLAPNAALLSFVIVG